MNRQLRVPQWPGPLKRMSMRPDSQHRRRAVQIGAIICLLPEWAEVPASREDALALARISISTPLRPATWDVVAAFADASEPSRAIKLIYRDPVQGEQIAYVLVPDEVNVDGVATLADLRTAGGIPTPWLRPGTIIVKTLNL